MVSGSETVATFSPTQVLSSREVPLTCHVPHMTVRDPSTQFKGCRQHFVLQESVKARRPLESPESEEELELCLLAFHSLYI